MKYVDLEILCIKNVARDGNMGLTADNYASSKLDVQYSDYFNNIDLDINQAISRLVTSNVLPDKEATIVYTYNEATDETKGEIDLSLSSVTDEIYKISNVIFVDEKGYTYTPPYRILSRTNILVRNPRKNGTYTITYKVSVPHLCHDDNAETDLNEAYGINDTMINSFIVNYTKAKMWESEEPQLAQNYMNYAESYLAAYKNDEDKIMQQEIVTEYSWF